jgi:quercetin dioxygenase-like cupin family protein
MTVIDVDTLRTEELEGHWGMVARPIIRQQGDQLVVLRCDMEPNGGANEHIHENQDHLFLLLDGQLDVTLDREETIRVKAGQGLLIEAGKPHATRNPGPAAARYVALTYASTPNRC